jgi:bifunctional NMN adenylyltransferase/nudix hydrolase
MNKKITVCFLRGMGLHQAHLQLMKAVDDLANADDGRGIVFIGSANVQMSPKNPFSFEQRLELFHSVGIKYQITKSLFLPLDDFNDNTAWALHVKSRVTFLAKTFGYSNFDVTIFDAAKNGEQSRYSEWFADWDYQRMQLMPGINATAIRQSWYEGRLLTTPEVVSYTLPETLNFMSAFEGSQQLIDIRRQYFA